MDYKRLTAALKDYETQHDRKAADKVLWQLAEYHRRRVAKNDRFVLRCETEINKRRE